MRKISRTFMQIITANSIAVNNVLRLFLGQIMGACLFARCKKPKSVTETGTALMSESAVP